MWLTDIAEHPTAEGKLYLCAVKDVWSNRIVAYSIDSRMKSRLAVQASTTPSRTGPHTAWTSPAASSTPIGGLSSGPGSSCAP